MSSKTNVKVRLVGEDGNAFCILGRCRRALSRAGKMDMWEEFHKQATSGNYLQLLATVMEYFDVDSDDELEDEFENEGEDED